MHNQDSSFFAHPVTSKKQDTFKKDQTLLPVASSNWRWFTIEQGEGGQAKDLLIFYYKKSSAEKEDCCGWLFLNNIVALSQDIPDCWITIEHPTRAPLWYRWIIVDRNVVCLLLVLANQRRLLTLVNRVAPTLVSHLIKVTAKMRKRMQNLYLL
jgi:hypothetical protein